jgi:hypothetical protein
MKGVEFAILQKELAQNCAEGMSEVRRSLKSCDTEVAACGLDVRGPMN